MLNTETELEWKSKLSLRDKQAYDRACSEHREQAILALGNKCSICASSSRSKRNKSLLHIMPIGNNSWYRNLRHYYKVLKKSPSIELEAYLLCNACLAAQSGKRTLKAYMEAKQAREQRHASFTSKVIRRPAGSDSLLDSIRSSEQANSHSKQA